jgi:hypothetical protein
MSIPVIAGGALFDGGAVGAVSAGISIPGMCACCAATGTLTTENASAAATVAARINGMP